MINLEKKMNLCCGDCLEIMNDIPSKSIDLIICDLPYGVTQNPNDIPLDDKILWSQYKRIIKDNGAILLFCQGSFFVRLVNGNPKWFRYDLIWNKELVTGFLNANRMPLRQHEQIAVFYKRLPTYNPQFSEGAPLHSKGKTFVSKKQTNNNYGKYNTPSDNRAGCTQKYPTSIISFKKPYPSVSNHCTEKPVALLEFLIKTYSNEGDVVLDNCMGSGSCGEACINTGRKFVGIEKNEEVFRSTCCRLMESGARK